MRSPRYKTGDVVRYIDDMAIVFGSDPKIVLRSIIIDKGSISVGVMYDLLEGDRQTKMWERWIVLV